MAKTITVKRPGIASGNITLPIIFNSDVPSSKATSLKEFGMLLKAFRIMNTPIGNIAVVWRNISPKYESVNPIIFNNL